MERSIALVLIGWKVDVVLETTLEHARSQVSTLVATYEEVSEEVLVHHQVYHSEHLDRLTQLLVGLDCPLVVIEPFEM